MVGIQKWLQIAVILAALAVLFWGVLTLNGISGQLSAINYQLTDMTGRPTLSGLGSSGSLYEIQKQLFGIESELSKINLYGIDLR